ncbi:glycosyltransferase [Clostridium sp.]|uniref:MGDG synthase family glycosyltransferase n=1 Tax=Clostridium sp. TaxID=1506 RepID=UPI003463D18B
MKVLMLSVSAGGGHMNAAKAIKSYILDKYDDSEVEIVDTLRYINPVLDKLIIGSYLKSLKISPSIFGMIYNHSETDPGIANVSNKINELFSTKIYNLIEGFNPDVLISTHPFSTEILSILKGKSLIDKPCITIMTDYTPHSFWIHPNVDAYIVSNDDMIDEMEERGVLKDKIFPFGIPVSPSFNTPYDNKNTLISLDLDPDKTTLLLMGGSLGMGNIVNVYKELISIPLDFQIIILAGNNDKLLSSLNSEVEYSLKETRIIGFTKEVNKYMQACDLLLTKPGGLTITEALISELPMALFSPIPGQEEKNAEFLLNHGVAIDLGDGINCKDKIYEILKDSELLKDMKVKARALSKPNSCKDMVNLIEDLIKK